MDTLHSGDLTQCQYPSTLRVHSTSFRKTKLRCNEIAAIVLFIVLENPRNIM